MNIDFGIIGQVIVEDMRDVLDIESARRHVGRHQHLELVGPEASQHAFARLLVEVAVYGFGGNAAHHQFIRKLARLGACARKINAEWIGFDLEQACQCVGFVVFVDR